MNISDPMYAIEARKIFIYGWPKTGKSTFASRMKGAYFISTEAGLDFLKTRNKVITSWPSFLKFLEKIKTLPEFDTTRCFVVDTVDVLYRMCYQHTLDQLGVAEPRQNYGKDWDEIRWAWTNAINTLSLKGKGVLFIGHAKPKVVDVLDGDVMGATMGTVIPSLPRQGKDPLLKLVDFAWCADQVTSEVDGVSQTLATLFTLPSDTYPECGGRMPLPETLPFNYKAVSIAYTEAIAKLVADLESDEE